VKARSVKFSDRITEIDLEPLSVENVGEIATLLNETWPTLYGNTGCIVFTEDYLKWLYGGPDSDRHILQGFRFDGKLMAVEAALFRQLSNGEKDWGAQLATHLTISPDLDLLTRIGLASKMSEALTDVLEDNEISIAYFEKAKGLVRSTRKIANGNSTQQIKEIEFRQAIVNAKKAQTLAKSANGITTRTAQKSDLPSIQTLIRNTKSSLFLNPSSDVLWYHITEAPGAMYLVAEQDAEIVGFLSTYVLDWTKDGQITRNIVAEVILGDRPEYLAVLLDSALEQAKSVGARGVVIDNITYLDEKIAYCAGIVSIPKEMVLVARCAKELPSVIQGFLIDVK
jgi:N-acetylglutamate synthase-like GNAT family acetyltransferase